MKVKRFDNLWTMGLILTSAILVLFYIAKIFFPELIVGVAEIPSIVKFGNYVDSHKWAFIIFHFSVSFLGGYVYACACCKKVNLNKMQTLILAITVSFLIFTQELLPQIYAPINYVVLMLMPFLMMFFSKELSKDTFCSTVISFAIDITAQALSVVIRNIVLLSTCINSATMTILLIDGMIWRMLLYLFFNYKNKKESE